jgi:hypothetical protein
MYLALKEAEHTLPWTRRLGSVAFESRLVVRQLQAADHFAYESRRYAREVEFSNPPMPMREPFKVFVESGRFGVRGLDADSLDRLAAARGWT